MKTQFDIEDYLDYLTDHLRKTLTKDFGADGGHIVDLLSNTTTQIDAIFYWMADYPREVK
jgi:hypothetical protein